ncbi:MAG: alkaline phosphatase family protein [Erythrobacter sp.]|nr:alkaline phosphatase family protein [Erythrobacter sp.]
MRALMLEFNELTPTLMDRFIRDGHLPNFERLRDQSHDFVTDAQEEPPFLEPWIQWVTVHTGKSYAEHQCFKLNDGSRYKERRLWDHCGAAGLSSLVGGSMNASFDPQVFRGHFIPDPWADDLGDYPADAFKPYLDVVRAFVKEHSGKPDISPMAMARFGSFMLANGLSIETMTATVKQLLDERQSATKWKRPLILDRLQWDLFKGLYKKNRPDFATFFLNSTAHFQHFYWREMEPDLFTIKPDEKALENHSAAILAGYKSMDRIVGQAFDLIDADTALILCTALSQKPMLTYEDAQGRQIFRQKDITQLLDFAGVTHMTEFVPVMSQEFMLHCENDDEARTISQQLEALVFDDGSKVMWAAPIGEGKINAGCKVSSDPGDALVRSTLSNQTASFSQLFYPLESLRSGMHDPHGLFWLHAPGIEAKRHAEPVPLDRVYPTLVDILGLEEALCANPSLIDGKVRSASLQAA